MSNEALEVPPMEQTPPAAQNDEQPTQAETGFDFSLIDNPTHEPNENVGLLKVKRANSWIDEAKNRPAPQMLFDCLWFDGELCILFADTNTGKSILAVQIADAISKGEPMPNFRLEASQQPVIYLDFELSDKQFEARYSENFTNHYRFSDNFWRVEINPDGDMTGDGSIEDALFQSIEQTITDTGARVLIVDNLTYLRQGTEAAKDALPLMKELKALKSRHGLSILALAHTPKRNLSNPLTRNDLQGSKMLINFCDSAFAIGESFKDKRLRYIKQIKQRNCEAVFDAENIILCEITKPYNFLQFRFVAYDSERNHLRSMEDEQRERNELIEKAKEMNGQGMTQRAIADQLKISVSTVNSYLHK